MALEVVEVLKINRGVNLETNMSAWAYEKNELYSVRSAYMLLKEEQVAIAMAMAATGETRALGEEQSWSMIWKLNVPSKVRVFWRWVLHNSLPLKAELKRIHVIMESYYEMCGNPEEALYHVVFLCPVSKIFWAEVKKFLGVTIPNLHPSTWATDVLHADVCSSNMTLRGYVLPGLCGTTGMLGAMDVSPRNLEQQCDIFVPCWRSLPR